MASTEAEDPSQSLKNKTSVLRVSIHCQGCKRKVQKLLQSVPGVEEIQIEAKLQRVVVTGDVSPETLLRKLVKAGKHAELWPEKPPEIRTKESEKQPTTSQRSVRQEPPVPVKEIKPPTTKAENPVEDPKKINKAAAPGGEPAVAGGKGDEGVCKSEDGKESAEVKPEEKKPETGSASNQPVGEKKEEQIEKDGGGGGGGGEGKKKKKKKAQNGDRHGSSSGPPPSTGGSVNGGGGGGPPPTRPSINESPTPRHHGYQYPPPHYYTPPPAPVYTVSYNTAQPPVNSYTASYYASPPPQSYAYSHFDESQSQMAPPPHVSPDYDSYRQQPSDSFEMFSDENPNGCLVM